MCEELKDELKVGKEAAIELVKHVYRMRARDAEIPVEVDGVKWKVKVELGSKEKVR